VGLGARIQAGDRLTPRPTTPAERRQHRRAVEARYAAALASGLIVADLRRAGERLRPEVRRRVVEAARKRRSA